MAGIYIHIPFCKQRCYYCDFHFTTSLKNKDSIIDAIIYELESRKEEITEDIRTIYFGGGTPSILSVGDIDRIINAVYKNYTITNNPEITIEANPDDINKQKVKELKNLPINRFSVGIQSFHQKDLEFMNRGHNNIQANDCIPILQDHGFDNITIDLIYGIPNQSKEEWVYNLNKTLEYNIPHISAYALTVEDKTPLSKLIQTGKYPKLSDEKAFEDFEILISKTKEYGLIQYEISNFGKDEYFSKHNSSYWKGEQYLGVGPSAHSFNGDERRWNLSNNKIYLENLTSNKYFEKEILSEKDIYNEYIMTGLRTIWGISINRIESKFTDDIYSNFISKIRNLEIEGSVIIVDDTVVVSDKFKFQTDRIISELFSI